MFAGSGWPSLYIPHSACAKCLAWVGLACTDLTSAWFKCLLVRQDDPEPPAAVGRGQDQPAAVLHAQHVEHLPPGLRHHPQLHRAADVPKLHHVSTVPTPGVPCSSCTQTTPCEYSAHLYRYIWQVDSILSIIIILILGIFPQGAQGGYKSMEEGMKLHNNNIIDNNP